MKVRFLKPALSEVDDAFVWYKTRSRGLGTQFLDEFDRAIDSETIVEVAIAHLHRKPQYWIDRIS